MTAWVVEEKINGKWKPYSFCQNKKYADEFVKLLNGFSHGTRAAKHRVRKYRRVNTEWNCIWKYDDIDNLWDTSCGEKQYFIEGDVAENKYKFCPYCGKKIKERT